jgi:hypothetical protein
VTFGNIDTTSPQAISLTYTPSIFTTGGVTATLVTDETIFLPSGWSGLATGTSFTKLYTGNVSGSITFIDLVGNQGSTGILITRTDQDSDGDGVPDYIEKNLDGTSPADKNDYKDTDGDGVPDYVEEKEGNDPADENDYKDSDGDGVPDYVEEKEGTNPADKNDYKDTDGDKMPDYVEEKEGTNPADGNDYKDSDGDRVPDYVEEKEGTDPKNPNDYLDNNRNGIPDYIEERRPSSGGGITLKKDVCPDGDFSTSYYDGECSTPFVRERSEEDTTTPNEHNTAEQEVAPPRKDNTTSEIFTAYERAYANKLTTMPTFEQARIADAITRAEMAKMMVTLKNLYSPPSLQ